MRKSKLQYHFHNPNPEIEMAGYLLKIFLEVNTSKVEKAIQAAAVKAHSTCEQQGAVWVPEKEKKT